jgi:hypothetical protein
MFIVYENAACVVVALIGATLLCSIYGMFLLLSKGVRILAAYAIRVHARRPSVPKKINDRVSPVFVAALVGSLPAAAWDIPSARPLPLTLVSADRLPQQDGGIGSV